MFSFRRDKAGFFITLILLTIVTGTVVSTLVLWIVGIAQGDWKAYLLSMKWVLGSAWVACIVTVLVRFGRFSNGNRIALWHDRPRASRSDFCTDRVRKAVNIMAERSLEERVAALEAEVTQLKNRIGNPACEKTGWEAIVGTFLNDPYYEKAMKYGREYRESLRPKKKKKKKK